MTDETSLILNVVKYNKLILFINYWMIAVQNINDRSTLDMIIVIIIIVSLSSNFQLL